jgi:hypothetical protein
MNKDEIIMKKRITIIFRYIVFLFCLTGGLCLLFFVLKQRYHPAKYTPDLLPHFQIHTVVFIS